MSNKHRTEPALETISLDHLEDVTGGRISASNAQANQQVMQALGSLAELIQNVGGSLVQAKSQGSQQMMQMMQQMMQSRQQR